MIASCRLVWAAMIAKMAAPMDAERAAKAIAAMLPMLANFADEVFTPESARDVCQSGRVMGDGTYGPLGRVPTFGELDGALGRWCRIQRERAAIRAPEIFLPRPGKRDPDPEVVEHVHAVVSAFVAERARKSAGAMEPRPRAKPAPLSQGALLATWEHLAGQNVPGADARVQHIRAAIKGGNS